MPSRWFASESEQNPQASLVFEHIVPKGKGLAFRLWHRRLANSARRCNGFMRADLCEPVQGTHLSGSL
jgi:antibiotic biosynthesis monooxygenase (ABM) superfamily enzyme